MVTKIIALFLLVVILAGSVQFADAITAVSSIFDGDTDGAGGTFDALSGASDIEIVTINGIPYAVVLGTYDSGIQIIDISDPTTPLAVSSIFNGDDGVSALSYPSQISTVTIGTSTYVLATAEYFNGVQIIDISIPSTPLAVSSIFNGDPDGAGGTFDALGTPVGVFTVHIGGIPYALVAGNTSDGVQIINISDPTTPLAVSSIFNGDPDGAGGTFDALDGVFSFDVITIGDITYALVVSIQSDGVQIIDISDPEYPLAVSSIFDGDDDTNRDTFDALDDPTSSHIVTINGKHYAIVVGLSHNTVQIIDISDPEYPLAVSSFFDGGDDTNGDTFDTLRGSADTDTVTFGELTFALVASKFITAGVQIINISDPTEPLAVSSIFNGDDGAGGTFDALTFPTSVKIVNIGGITYALVTSIDDNRVQIIDISSLDPSPVLPPMNYTLEDTVGETFGNDQTTGAITLDLSGLRLIGTDPTHIVIPEALEITTSTANVLFPAETSMLGVQASSMVVSTSTKIPTGFSSYGTIVEVGDPDADITLDNPVSITLFGQAGLTPFFINAASQTFVITTVCVSNVYLDVQAQLAGANGECYLYSEGNLVIWTKHFTGGGAGNLSGTDNKSNGGGSGSQWKTKPTFGLSHDTYIPLVDGGFAFNNNTFDITDNWHTPFDRQNVTLGELNSFSAKAYANKQLQVQEFLFGIPHVGQAHKAELGVEVWYDVAGNVTETKMIQKTNVIDPTTLNATGSKVSCQESDAIETCYITTISMVFLEPLHHDVMAIKAIDFEKRYHITYLNEGFNIDGKSLNPMLQSNISGTEKYEGPITVTQVSKYSNIWVAEDGREFERNDSGSFKHINKTYERHTDPGDAKNRLHSEFVISQQYEIERANTTLADLCPRCNDVPYDKIGNIIQIIQTSTHRNFDTALHELIIFEELRAEQTLDEMIKENYSNNPFYKEFRK